MDQSVRDVLLIASVATTFALLVTSHLAIIGALLRKREHMQALAALVIPFLSPIWAFRQRMWLRGSLWIAGGVLYAIALGVTLWWG